MFLKISKYLILFAIAAFFACCASATDEEVELAQMALDHGDWNDAIAHGNAALADDPSSVKAALVLSNGYVGRSGFTVMKLTSAIADESREKDIFDAIHDAIVETVTDFDDLRTAIKILLEHLIPQPGGSNTLYKDHQFQAGLLLAIEAFAKPSLAIQDTMDSSILPENITSDIRDLVQADFLASDDFLVNAGMTNDNEVLQNIRQTYCVLKNLSSSSTGFDLALLQDITLCQQSPNDGADLTIGDFRSPNVTNCSDFNYEACESAPPTEP